MADLEVADVFRRHGSEWRAAEAGHLDRMQRRVMGALEACRTAVLGGHVRRCADCGHAVVYAILFRAAAETLRVIAADPRHLGAEIGGVAVLHTWGQAMQHHPHVHCIVPGGGLSPDGARWIACPPGFFLSVKALGRLFRRLFLERLAHAFDAGELRFFGELAPLADADAFAAHCAMLRRVDWVVYGPSARSAGPSRCWRISGATPTASPSPTAGSSA